MILFSEDWSNYPTAIVDMKTKNESWIRLAALFKKMGVKNCYFHLSLMTPELQGVDPHSPNLTKEQKAAIANECRWNPWYFFREVLRAPLTQTQGIPFKANRGIISLLWAFFIGIDYILIMIRQTGKSTTADGLWLYLLYFGQDGLDYMLHTKDAGLREKNIARLKNMRSFLPVWLVPHGKNDPDNTETIYCTAKKTRLWTAVGQPSIENAVKVGRGFTLAGTQTDEAVYIPNISISMPAMLAATNTGRANARALGAPNANIITTTSGKKDSASGKYIYKLLQGSWYWNERIYDCANKEEARKLVSTNSSSGMINGTFSHRQLGFTDEWLVESIRNTKDTDPDSINRDWYNVWTSGSEYHPLSTKLLEAIAASECEPLWVSTSNDLYQIRWYIPQAEIEQRMRSGWYVIGLDSSNAIGRDANAMVLVDVRDMSIVATSTISEANLLKYGLWLANFMIRYERTTLVIENKSSAQSIIDIIAATFSKYGIDVFKRVFNYVVEDKDARVEDYKDICTPVSRREESVYLRFKSQLGFQTNGNRRYFLYDTVFQEAAKSTGHLIKDANLLDEIKGLVLKNGRVDHETGSHDDSVIAWLLCHWFVKHAKNLTHYGITPTDCLSLVSDDGAMLSEEALANRKKVAVLNMEIAELKEKMYSAPNVIESARYEKLIAWKVREAQQLGDVTLSLDAILRDVRENKVSKQNLRDAVKRFSAQRRSFGKAA